MRTLLIVLVAALPATDSRHDQARYSKAVTRICAGAQLFSGTHVIGTRAGAIAVSRDIRTTGMGRMSRIDAVPKPTTTATFVAQWISDERGLVQLYASNYLRIWYAIERADTRDGRARLPGAVRALIDQPRPLERRAAVLEAKLRVPDCTGGGSAHRANPAPPRPIG